MRSQSWAGTLEAEGGEVGFIGVTTGSPPPPLFCKLDSGII